MDSSRFDSLARALSDAGTNRRTLTSLLGGALLTALPMAAEARKKRQRHKHKDAARQDHHGSDVDSEKKKKKKKKCKPDSAAVTCAGKCGSVTNNCKQAVNCGSCACSPACAVCFTCQAGPNTPGTCVPDPQKVGQSCGGSGQVCQADGTCVCSNSACSNPTPVCGQEICEACASNAQCQAAGKGDICCNGSCVTGNCCNNSACTNPTPSCIQSVCSACSSASDCAANEICDNGSCEQCDVCVSGCTYSSPQAAIDDGFANGADEITIRICPGTFGRVDKDNNDPDITIIGAGDGEDPTSNTILTDPGTADIVNLVFGTSTLRGLRITGGGGSGLSNNFATLSLTNCTISDNHAPNYPGGILNSGTLNATNVKVIGNTAGVLGGGILNDGSITFAGTNLVAFNQLTNPGANTGSGIYNNPSGTITGFGNVEVRDNEPPDFQCFNCPQ